MIEPQRENYQQLAAAGVAMLAVLSVGVLGYHGIERRSSRRRSRAEAP